MAKKLSASSHHAKLVRVSAESISNKPLNMTQKASLTRLAKRPIDYSDIPEFTEAPLREFRRPAKKLVAVRLGPAIRRASTMSSAPS